MKTKLTSLLFLIVLHTAADVVLAEPLIGIASTNNQIILFWSNSKGTNEELQSCTDLTLNNWLSVTDAIPFNYASQTAATVPNSLTVRCFRLSQVSPTTDGMSYIPAGSFTIGNSTGDTNITNAIPTNVYVSGFFMDTNLVGFGQWSVVYDYATSQGYDFVNPGSGNTANDPVQTVDWYDCLKWCNARSQQAGLTPVYYMDAELTSVYTNGEVTPYVNWSANGYRLPTEAEWEKAARGGLSGQRFPLGNTISESQANYFGQPETYSYDLGPYGFNPIGNNGTTPIGTFSANGYGLYDMAGNVFEWCWDCYSGPPYPMGSPYLGGSNPHGPGPGSGNPVRRGGSWNSGALGLQCACRGTGFIPTSAVNYVGFRCVRGI